MEAAPLKTFLDGVPGGFLITDITSKVLYANDAVARRSGFTVGEIIGKRPGDLWGGRMDRKFYQTMWQTIRHEGRSFVGRVENKQKNGTLVRETLHIAPVKDTTGAPRYFVEIRPPEVLLAENFDVDFGQRIEHWQHDRSVWNWVLEKLAPGRHRGHSFSFERDLLSVVEDELIAPTAVMFLRRFEDIPLIEAAQRDGEAFAKLYKKYQVTIKHYFLRRLGEVSLAEDLTQEVFAKAFHYLPTFRVTNASYLTYLFHIAHSILVNYYRKQSISPQTFPLESLSETGEETTTFPKESFEVLLQALNPIEREVMLLTYRDGFRAREIAEQVGKTENAIKLLLSRSRKKLRLL